nr:lactate racemase domain-containing protein [Halalkalicoccus sp. NIPERK01]
MPALLEAAVDELRERGFEPAVIAAMGSHGGATGEGQRETLEALGITEDRLGCAIHTSMDVDEIGRDSLDRPVYVAEDALAMDAVILANRIKPHTDFHGPVESGLCKMAVIGLGKHRGAESLHNAGLASDFSEVIRERAELIIEESPVIGGIGLIEDAADRAAHVEGVPADRILEREPELLDIAREELPTLPVDDLDVLILDEMGKDVSGTGMDTNVIGRVLFHGEDEPDSPRITRIYARSLTPASHGNGVGLGLADFVHRSVVDELDLGDTYVNIVTSGETTRARIPLVVPDDLTALVLACSTTGVADPADLRVARIENTMEPDDLLVSEPVARELASREDVSVGELEPLGFEDGKLEPLD